MQIVHWVISINWFAVHTCSYSSAMQTELQYHSLFHCSSYQLHSQVIYDIHEKYYCCTVAIRGSKD